MRLPKTKNKILLLLSKNNIPLDAVYLTKNIKVNKTTIYRDLESLLSENKIKDIDLGDGKKRYELTKNHHHHLVCSSCGKIENIQISEKKILDKFQTQTNFLIENHSIEFFGKCINCQ